MTCPGCNRGVQLGGPLREMVDPMNAFLARHRGCPLPVAARPGLMRVLRNR